MSCERLEGEEEHRGRGECEGQGRYIGWKRKQSKDKSRGASLPQEMAIHFRVCKRVYNKDGETDERMNWKYGEKIFDNRAYKLCIVRGKIRSIRVSLEHWNVVGQKRICILFLCVCVCVCVGVKHYQEIHRFVRWGNRGTVTEGHCTAGITPTPTLSLPLQQPRPKCNKCT